MNQKVAIYVRVSTTNQAEEGYSVQEQQNALSKYAEAMGWTVYKEYVDAGFSGGKLERPAINNLIQDSKLKVFDTVLVYKLDRLSRSVRDTLYLIRDVFQKSGIQFISLQESIDTNSPVGNFFLTQLSAIAEFERDQITERMKMGKVGRAKAGKSMMWARTAYGYKYDKKTSEMYIDGAEGEIVRLIYKKYLEGMSISKLRDFLDEHHMETRERPWTYRIIRTILSNPVYAGYIRFKGEIYEGLHEPLVSKDMFELTQKEISKRQQQTYERNKNPRPFQAKYMLSGLAQCGYCLAPLLTKMTTPRKDGTRIVRYECYNRKPPRRKRVTVYNDDKKCDSGFYYMSNLEEFVLSEINKLKADPAAVLNKDIENDVEDEAKNANRELEQISKKLERLNDLYLIDSISLDELQQKSKQFNNRKRELEKRLEQKKSNKIDIERLNKLLDFQDIYSLDYEQQKFIAKSLIKKVRATSDVIEILWNF